MSGEVTVIVMYPGGDRQQQVISEVTYSAVWKRMSLVNASNNTPVKKFSDLVDGETYLLLQQADDPEVTAAASALQLVQTVKFDPSTIHRYNQFQPDGFGPFVVKREDLMRVILAEANPHSSVHICGCKGSSKTTLLKLLGEYLVDTEKKHAYFLKTAGVLSERGWTNAISMLIQQKHEAYFLLDETQTAGHSISAALVQMLKNNTGHKLTVIGAGVPEFKTLSANFSKQHRTHELFLSGEDLLSSGAVGYFDGTSKSTTILEHIRDHCGGHIYPLMRGMELMKKLSNYERMTQQDVITYYESPEFRRSAGYRAICSRVLPPMSPEEIHPLFYSTKEVGALDCLRKKGFVSQTGSTVLSYLLLDAYVASLGAPNVSIPNLRGGLEGIKQVPQHSLPDLQWSQYDSHGGPVEDSLSFELLAAMANIRQLTARLFNPKLVDVGTSWRRPDIYINSQVNSYIECLLTESHTETDKASLDEHIGRFCYEYDKTEVSYTLLEGQDWAVLNFQRTGMLPLEPSDAYSNLFQARVFTFLMATRQIYRGNEQLNAD